MARQNITTGGMNGEVDTMTQIATVEKLLPGGLRGDLRAPEVGLRARL